MERKQELGREESGGGDLQAQAEQLWQTPATDSFRSRGGDRKDEMGLDQQARIAWPTPAARDYRSETGGGSDDETLRSSSGAEFACDGAALFPPGPADAEGWRAVLAERPWLAPATEPGVCGIADGVPVVVDASRTDSLRALGNAVLGIQGAAAFIELARRMSR